MKAWFSTHSVTGRQRLEEVGAWGRKLDQVLLKKFLGLHLLLLCLCFLAAGKWKILLTVVVWCAVAPQAKNNWTFWTMVRNVQYWKPKDNFPHLSWSTLITRRHALIERWTHRKTGYRTGMKSTSPPSPFSTLQFSQGRHRQDESLPCVPYPILACAFCVNGASIRLLLPMDTHTPPTVILSP